MATGKRIGRDIVHRWEGNPLISMKDLEFRCADVRNAGVAIVNGETVLLVTIEGLTGVHSIHLARVNRAGIYCVEKDRFISRDSLAAYGEHALGGAMDARVTELDGWYYITFVLTGEHGFRLAVARTRDFETVEHIGIVGEPDTKAGALFPVKFAGRYAILSRPESGGSIWISYSEDLRYWSGGWRVMAPRSGFWDQSRIGVGCPPIEVEMGWLLIYYGAKDTSAGPIYRLGAAVLDRNDPSKVVGRSVVPILTPRESYERIGDIPNMVFATGCVAEEDGGLRIYYGGSDSCICVGDTTVDEVVVFCINGREE
ncbi:MAG: glycoside hydrolase family 130 protein [Planctomycetes bacterium]|nr:glycoside hydrolase family 130 protein [Planctomycetota bacterium]